jgi:hypothetical protein
MKEPSKRSPKRGAPKSQQPVKINFSPVVEVYPPPASFTEVSSFTLKDATDMAPKGLALLLAMLIAYAVAHEYGYFTIVGSYYLTFATSFDYVINALLWLPSTLFLLFLYSDIGAAIREAEIKRWTFGRFLRHNMYIQLFFFAFSFLFGSIIFPLAMSVCVLVVWIIVNLFPESDWYQVDTRLYRLIVFVPAALIGSFGYGLTEAYNDLRSTKDVYRIGFKEGRSPANVIMLRNFEKGFLVHDKINSRIEFIPREAAISISRISPSEVPSLSCKWFDVLCGKATVGSVVP